MNFSDQPPSTRWVALTFRGERLAEVWFKPESDPYCLVFRIPQSTFAIPGIGPRLTAESLLKTVGMTADEIESWHSEDVSRPLAELNHPIPQPPPDIPHVEIRIRVKSPSQEAAVADWDGLEAVWKSVLSIEAAVEASRKMVEGVKSEIESAARRSLSADEKVYALSSDVTQWNQAKSRAHFAVPKASDFIHRATWAATAAERKRLGEIFETPDGAKPSDLPPGEQLLRELESLRKARQVLAAQGTAVYQECRAIASDVQGALRRLQANAATRAAQKKGGPGRKGKSF